MPGMAVKAKEFRYAIDLGEGGTLRIEDGTALEIDPSWSPEHLLLAALVRCSLKSLSYHARRRGTEVANAHGSARALFAKRESDERYPRSTARSSSTCGSPRNPARTSSQSCSRRRSGIVSSAHR